VNMNHELLHAIADTVLAGLLIPSIWGAVKLFILLRSFPMHLHVNGKVVYPEGWEPPVVKALGEK